LLNASKLSIASNTVNPPVPESNTPIGAADFPFFWAKPGASISINTIQKRTDLKTDIKKTC